MSGNLAGQAMVVRSIWKSARACRAVASFEGSLKKILKGLEHQNIKMSSLEMTEKITLRSNPPHITFNTYCETR